MVEREARRRDRIPPGQRLASGWPVLHVGEPPPGDLEGWELRVSGLVETPLRWEREAIDRLPSRVLVADLHCLTGWSRLEISWEGVGLREVTALAGVKPAARFVRFADGRTYETTLPLAVALDEEVLLATRVDGRPLALERGGPLRLVVPSRYGTKSVKWLRGIEFLADDRFGFWETRGYSNAADPWREERYA